MKSYYSTDFYKNIKDVSFNSALQVVPILISMFKPESVIDIGCGIGTWLRVFKDSGVQEICGVDGEYVSQKLLMIPPTAFIPFNLCNPLKIDRKYDLAISLEVAEHLPEDKADTFVETLVSLAPVIVFSASIPFQGGTNHLNEQWQSYWANKFKLKGYYPTTCLKDKIWHLPNVLTCYKQNMIIFVCDNYKSEYITDLNRIDNNDLLNVVHPEMYEFYANPEKLKSSVLKTVLYGLPRLINIIIREIAHKYIPINKYRQNKTDSSEN